MPNERENYEGIVKRGLKEEWCGYISYITTLSEKISLKAKHKARIVPEKSILVSCIGIIGNKPNKVQVP